MIGSYSSRFAISLLVLSMLILGFLVLDYVGESLEEPRPEALAFEGVGFEPGDVLFRRGRSLMSRAVLSADTASRFSHVGIVHLVEGDPVVVHASPGASLVHETKIKVEPVASFLGQTHASAAALYRPREKYRAIGERAAVIAHGYALEERVFDAAFSLATENALYCTELVWRSYLEAGLDLVDSEFDHLPLPLYQEKCLLPSRLQASPYLQLVYNSVLKGRSK